MRCCLMRSLLEVSLSGTTFNKPDASAFNLKNKNSQLSLCSLRCASPRAYRLPPFALINLSHGVRTDHGFHKLTAIVKPQPSTANFYSNRQMGGLNHSPRSPFVPTQVEAHNTTTDTKKKKRFLSSEIFICLLFPLSLPTCSTTTSPVW